MLNQNPEQLARDEIDKQLLACSWVVQHKKEINLSASQGVAVREYQTDIGPADYVLFINKKPVGIIEGKRAEEGVHLTIHEERYGNSVRSFGVNQSNINGTKLKSYPIPLPPLKEQKQIVQEIESRLSVADKMEESINQSIQQAEALRQSILKKAFEGKLI